jgi:TonB family protein
MNIRHDTPAALLPALAVLCTVGSVYAQNFVSTPASPQLITNHRQLASMVLAQPAPQYPPVARINYIEGPVQLEITVNNTGRVSNAHVLIGNPILAAAALKAVSQWIYLPLKTQAGPVEFTAKVKLKFCLHRQPRELTPRQAELDFQRQVKPAQLVNPANQSQHSDVVRMRLLVNDQGRVIDTDAERLDKTQVDAVMGNLRAWTFRPAHWGTLPIAAYLNLDVPVGPPAPNRTAANSHAP